MSLFTTINTALSGLLAQQQALEITGNNVANAQTPGYHRQQAVLSGSPATAPVSPSAILLSAGVNVADITASRNAFLARQSDGLSGQVGRWSLGQQSLTSIQSVIAPGSNLDLSSMLDNFFGAWQQLAADPETSANRNAVQSAGETLANTLNNQANQLSALAQQTTADLTTRVDKINTLADTLAQLNQQIAVAQASGTTPNDLLDQQETTRNAIAQLAGTTTLSGNSGEQITNLGGRALVEGAVANHLSVANGQVVWADQPSQAATIHSGEIAGIQELQQTVIPGYQTQLDDIARTLANTVNALHNNANNATGAYTATGTAAGDFFTGTTAASIAVDPGIVADAGQIAAAKTASTPGDGSVANAIAQVAKQLLIGNQTLGQAAQGMLGQIGTAVQSAQTNLQASQALQTQVQTQQASQSGVSIDEEMSNLLVYQHAYEASAHVMSVANDMLSTFLSDMH